ncbi:MAG: PepSY-associated TM helix domain-containing protein [Pseudomonadota bacterium]
MNIVKTLPIGSRPGERGKTAKPRTTRQRLYELHAWTGFHLAVVMFVVLFTGTFATISNELDWLVQDDMRVTPGDEEVSMEVMLDAVRDYAPSATILGIQKMMGDRFAYRVTVFDDNATQQFIHVDQWTGEVTGQTPYFTLQRLFRDFHRYLYLPKVIGLTIVCSMGVILLISLYTGLKTSRNWRTLMTRIRTNKGMRVFIGDAHKSAGLWSVWFIVLMIVTGLWYYAEFLGKNFEPPVPNALRDRGAIPKDVFFAPSVEDITDIAQEAFPELEISAVTFSSFAGSSIRVMGSAGNPIVRQRANAVYLDPTTLEVLHVRRASELPTVQWLNQIADPLHFGDFGGLTLKLVYFVFGLFMTGLSASGVWLTMRRLKRLGVSRLQIGVLPVILISVLFASLTYSISKLPILAGLRPAPYVWYIVGLFLAGGAILCSARLYQRFKRGPIWRIRNVTLAVLTLSMTAGATHATLLQNPFLPASERGLGQRTTGPVVAELYLETTADNAMTGSARFIIESAPGNGVDSERGRLNLKSMSVDVFRNGVPIDDDATTNRKFRLATVRQPAYLRLPSQSLEMATDIVATFELHNGAAHTLQWSLVENR